MKKIKLFIILLLLAVLNFNATAQNAGDIDTTFNTADIGFGNGDGADDNINSCAIQPDGKIIIGGDFYYYNYYNGTTIIRIARLNADGMIDNSFNSGTGPNSTVITCALQSDGKIIIVGGFTTYNGTTRNRIARLNVNGTLDTSFNPGTGANNTISTCTIQPDGKIIIGGDFTTYNGTTRNRIARLNVNGTLDTSFNPGTGANNTISTCPIQPDGKIIIGGNFTSYNGTNINRIARLNTDGTLDTIFNPGTGANFDVKICILQPDEQLIIGGTFTSYNGTARYCIARLNVDGTLDASFNPGTGANNSVYTFVLQPDGKIIIGGVFTSYNGTARNYIARLNANGTLDTSFNPGTGAANTVNTCALLPNGQLIIGGSFTYYNETARGRIACLNANGSLDISFNPGTGANFDVFTSALQPDGKIIIGGFFTTCNGTESHRIARLNEDGTLDTSFNSGIGANHYVWTCVLQPDGKIIIGGNFTSYNGAARNYIARLNSDGTLDASFNPGTGASSVVLTCVVQPDGKIIIGGNFTSYNGATRIRIARLNADGTLDTSFNPVTGVDNAVNTCVVQPDGKIIIGGKFTSYNGTTRIRIARLNADGTLDTSFNSGTGANNDVNACVLQSDGKIFIGGTFTSYNGTNRNGIARLNANGTLDTGFNPGTGVSPALYLYTLTRQPDGKIIIGGQFTSYKGIGRNRIARVYGCSVNFGTDVQTACNNFTWIDGNTYTTNTNTPTFTLTNAAGCDSVVTLNLTINNVNASYISIDNTNGNYTFTNTSTGTFNQTHWAFGDGITSTATNPNHTFSANGTYVVVLTVNDSTSSSCMDYYLDTIVVTGVVAPLQCAAGFVMYPDTTINNVIVVNSSTGSNLTYLWDFGDGNTSNAQFPTHTYAASGPYYLCLSIDDGAGCVDMYCDSIGENGVVFNKQTGFTINVIAPPLVTQISEQAAITSAMSIYPNPTGKKLNVVFNKNEQYQLKIVTIDGKLIETKTIVGNTTLDVSNYSSGMYFITATNNEGKVYQSKFVKE